MVSMRIGIDCIVMLKMLAQDPFSSLCLVLSNALVKTAFLIQSCHYCRLEVAVPLKSRPALSQMGMKLGICNLLKF